MAKSPFLQALPFIGGLGALAAPFIAPALFGAEAGAGAIGADIGAGAAGAAEGAGAAAAAPLTAGAAAPLTAGVADITLPEVAVTATPLSAGAGADIAAGAGLAGGLSDAFGGAVPALATSVGAAGPLDPTSLGPAPGSSPVNANMFTSSLTNPNPIDPGGFSAPATDIPSDITPDYLTGTSTTEYAGTPGAGVAPNYGAGTATTNYAGIPATAPTTSGGGGILGQAGDWLGANKGWIGPAAAIGGLGLSALRSFQPIPGSPPITNIAGTANTNAANLMAQAGQNLGALNTGALPAGAQSAIDEAANAAKATIRSQFANMGITGPYSGEAEALATVDQNAATQKLQQEQNLVNLGATEAGLAQGQYGLASQDYLALMQAQIQRDAALQSALARFSGALAGPALAAPAAAVV